MAPKSRPNAAKQAAIMTWLQKSGVAHSIKDLEKALPSIASINGMQVKDYLQSLQDESMIRVEKIGSGNWYWNFPSEEKRNRMNMLESAQEERDKVKLAIEELQRKIEAKEAEREDGDVLKVGEESRKSLTKRHAALLRQVEILRDELALYSDSDPAEVKRKREHATLLKEKADLWTDQIMSIEDWVKENLCGDREQLLGLKRQWYGYDFDEEEEGLRELE